MAEDQEHRLLAAEVARWLRDAGHRALFAGGCVRDLLLGTPPKDFDIATSATPDEIQRLFPETVAIGASFGVTLVIRKGVPFEVTTFRSDGRYLDGRHPSTVTFGDEREDALRRDFTINGLFLDPETGAILDYVGGREDLDRRLIRTIGDPEARFREDRLRMLRAVRFHANLGFEIEAGTRAALHRMASEIVSVSQERIRDELFRILTGPAPRRGFVLLEETGLLEFILPEVAAMRGVEQPREFHPEGDVWTHTLLMLEGLQSPTPELALGVLLHDVGKPPTFLHEEGDRIRFHRHEEVGARMAAEICRRLRCSRNQVKRVEALVAEHMKFQNLPRMRESRRRRFLSREDIEDHLELHRLDCIASHRNLDIYRFCREKLAAYATEPAIPPPLVDGCDLLRLGLSPGPLVGRLLREIQDAQLEGSMTSREEAIAHVRARLERGERSRGGEDPGERLREEEEKGDRNPDDETPRHEDQTPVP